MTTQSQTEVLTLALEAGFTYNDKICLYQASETQLKIFLAIAHAKALAQPAQEQNLKLMPREATPEMLKAMDECSTEGYDERLYEGHAGSVYMAAWDAFYGQHCYCGDITNLGVIHRDDGPCHYPEHKEPEQEPVAWESILGAIARGWCYEENANKTIDKDLAEAIAKEVYALGYTTPPQRKE